MKRITITISAGLLMAAMAMTMTSCGGNDNKGMTDGTVTVGMNTGNSTANGNGNSTASGNGSDILDGTANSSR